MIDLGWHRFFAFFRVKHVNNIMIYTFLECSLLFLRNRRNKTPECNHHHHHWHCNGNFIKWREKNTHLQNKNKRNTNRSGANVLIWNGWYMVLFENRSGLTMLRIKINIKLNRTGIKISSTVCIGWRYWMRKFFHISRRNLSKFVAIFRSSSLYVGGTAFVPISILLWWFCGGDDDDDNDDGSIVLLLMLGSQFNGCVQSLALSIDVEAVQYDDADDDKRFGLWRKCRWYSCSSSPLSQFTCS